MSGLASIGVLFGRRLKRRPLRFALSVFGIAAGVALVFAVTTINAGIAKGFREFERSISGSARTEVVARSPEGLDQRLYRRVRAVPTASVAAISQHAVELRRSGRSAGVTMIGGDAQLARLGGRLARHIVGRQADEGAIGLYLPGPVAKLLDARAGDLVRVAYAGDGTERSERWLLVDRSLVLSEHVDQRPDRGAAGERRAAGNCLLPRRRLALA